MAAASLPGLGIKRILSSPLSRTVDTAKAAEIATGAQLATDKRLVERGFGTLEGMTVAEVKQKYGYGDGVNFHLIDGPEIEASNVVIQRAHDAICDYPEASKDFSPIVAHGQIFTMFIEVLTGETVRFANAKPYLIEPGGSGWKISCFGEE